MRRPRSARPRALAVVLSLPALVTGSLLGPPAAVAAPGDPDVLVAQFRDQVARVTGSDGAATPLFPTSDDVTAVHRTPSGVTFVAEDGGRVLRYPAGDGRPVVLSRGGGDVFGLAAEPDGTLYVGRAGGADNGLERIAPDRTSTMLVENRDLYGVALLPDGGVLAATGSTAVVPGSSPGVLRVDGSAVTSRAVGAGFAADVAVGPDGEIVVTDNTDGSVVRLAGLDGAAEDLPSVPGAFGAAVTDAGDVLVSSDSGDRVVALRDGAAAEVLTSAVVNPVDLSVVTDPVGTTTELVVERQRLVATVTATGGRTPTGPVVFSAAGEQLGTATLRPVPGSPGTAEAVLQARAPTTPDPIEVTADYGGDLVHDDSDDSYERTNPVITAALVSDGGTSPSGWYRRPVTVEFSCSPGSSPVTTCSDPVRRAGDGVRTVRGAAAAEDGGRASTSVTVKIDQTRPELDVEGADGGPYPPSARPLRCVATDATSGVDSCVLTYRPKPDRPAVRWFAVATDKAGNTRRQTGTYRTT